MPAKAERIGAWIECVDCLLSVSKDMVLETLPTRPHEPLKTKVSYADGRVVETETPMDELIGAITEGIPVAFAYPLRVAVIREQQE